MRGRDVGQACPRILRFVDLSSAVGLAFTRTSACAFVRKPKSGHYLCPPGDPMVGSMGTNLGPAGGGTAVQIHGENFGWVTGVFGPGS
jgi:hypothetical protein